MPSATADPYRVSYSEYGEAIGNAVAVVRNNAIAAGMQAPVPTCPGWTVLDLVVHLGVVQRWATAIVTGIDPRAAAALEAENDAAARAAADPLDWLDDGQVDLLNALAVAPADLEVFFFLKNAPSARDGWARRQAHEASIHAVDAMAARLAAAPSAARTWITPGLAVDGIDELLTGFVTRRSSALRSDHPLTVHVAARDTGHAWTMRVGADPAVTTRHRHDENAAGDPGAVDRAEADVTITGGAVALYLAVWNRGEEVDVTARPEIDAFWDRWRQQVRISWS